MAITQLKNWAQSALARPIELWHSENAFAHQARPLILMGGVHGDEPEGVELAVRTLDWLKKDHEQVKLPWILIPNINPDGVALNQRTNGNGVDLNRNYPSTNWSPEAKAERYYPGPAPGSEPEIKALVKLFDKVSPRLIVHCHSWEPMVVCTGDAGLKDAGYLSESCGYPVVNEIGYPTPGGLSQYGWHDKKIPIICIEEEANVDLKLVWPHFAQGIQKMFLDTSDRLG